MIISTFLSLDGRGKVRVNKRGKISLNPSLRKRDKRFESGNDIVSLS
jgi:hypothetical protein